MNGFFPLVKKEIHRFMSMWIQTLIGPVSTAFLYQLIFGHQFAVVSTVGNLSYSAFLIPGLIMMQVLLNSFGNGSSTLIQSKYTGNLVFILMAPITPFSMYTAYLTASILRGVVVGLAVYLGIFYFGTVIPHSFFILFYFLILGAAITSGLGLIAGILSSKFEQLAGFQSFVLVPMIYLSGVFFNPNHLPGFWSKVAKLDPFLYIVDGFRYGFTHETSINLTFGIWFILGCAVVINYTGYFLLKKGIKIKF